jgi:hypothetical protein
MADSPQPPAESSHAVFAMNPEATLQQLVRHLVEMQEEMAALGRDARIVRSCGISSARLQAVLNEWERFQREWVTQRLPSLTAAMKLALEVYDTFGPGMTRLDDPIDAGIWNNKYFVWERRFRLTSPEPRR